MSVLRQPEKPFEVFAFFSFRLALGKHWRSGARIRRYQMMRDGVSPAAAQLRRLPRCVGSVGCPEGTRGQTDRSTAGGGGSGGPDRRSFPRGSSFLAVG